jgi:DNA-binding GntR family transcriptional regulator
MDLSPFSIPNSGALVKDDVAATLRSEITSGKLLPGARIVEADWAARAGVSQSSIREALNILSAEGFIQKRSGRSARVTKLSAEDVRDMYEVRARIEGLAAGLLARNTAPLNKLEEFIAQMRRAIDGGDMEALIINDLGFHLQLCHECGNRVLEEHARQLLLPLFAFTRMRALANKVGMDAWIAHIPTHQQIVEIIRVGDPLVAEQFVSRIIVKTFGRFAYDIWENRPVDGTTGR